MSDTPLVDQILTSNCYFGEPGCECKANSTAQIPDLPEETGEEALSANGELRVRQIVGFFDTSDFTFPNLKGRQFVRNCLLDERDEERRAALSRRAQPQDYDRCAGCDGAISQGPNGWVHEDADQRGCERAQPQDASEKVTWRVDQSNSDFQDGESFGAVTPNTELARDAYEHVPHHRAARLIEITTTERIVAQRKAGA